MSTHRTRMCRRSMLKKAACWIASLAALPLTLGSTPAGAKKVTREIVQYRDEPKSGKVCVNCWAYVADPTGKEGTCQVVEGPISPNGWCMAFSPKRETRTPRRT